MTRVQILATDEVALEAAREAALGGASALRAVVTGYFAAAGMHPGVLLSSLSLLVSSFGAVRGFDGRLRQPGRGSKRPRGFIEGEAIPEAAYLAVPSGAQCLAVAVSYDEDRRNAAMYAAGIAHAKRQGALRRAWVLGKLRDSGGPAWSDPALHRPLLHRGGASEGGLVSLGDFVPMAEVDFAAVPAPDDDRARVVPWGVEPHSVTEGSELQAVVAVDRRGTAALLCYEQCTRGIEVDELELRAPRAARPVRRGITRTTPGAALPMPAPLRLLLAENGLVQRAEAQIDGVPLGLSVLAR